jgi:hypothetical protein
VEAVSQTTVATPQVQVKDVFPSDESDFEMIERYNGASQHYQ